MVNRAIIGKSGEEKIVDLLKDIQRRASEANTSPSGNKVLESDEDFYWYRPDGSEHSMREVDEGLEDARLRIEGAEQELIETGQRLESAEQTVADVRDDLDNLEFAGGSNNFYQPEPPLPTDDPAPTEGSIWFDTNDQNKPYIYRDEEWLSARDDSFLSTARNLTPWVAASGNPHALAGQAVSVPSGEMKVQTGVIPSLPAVEAVGIALDLESDTPGLASTTTLPFQGGAPVAGSPSSWTETAMPYEGRPIGASATVLFGVAGTPGTTAQLIVEATFFGVAGTALGARQRITVTARELDSEDPAESFYLDGYGFTHIATADGVLEPPAAVAPDVVSFALSWHIRLPRASGSTAWVTAAEARVQVPESGIAAGAITTPKIATGAITADSGIIGSIDAGTITVGEMEAERLKVNDALSARIVQAMSAEVKELVVTESAILNHATLLGTTVVEQINVMDKLVGTDGVFTGTVDFANVNVTGDLLAERVSGKTLIGNSIIGAGITALESSGRSVYLAGDAVPWFSPLSPGPPSYYPGIRFAHENGAGNIGVVKSSPDMWTGSGVEAMGLEIISPDGARVGGRVVASSGNATLFGPPNYSGSTYTSAEVAASSWRASLISAGSRLLVDGLPSQEQILLDTPGGVAVQGQSIHIGPELYSGKRVVIDSSGMFLANGSTQFILESSRLYTPSPFVVGNGLRTTGNFTVEGTTNLQSNFRSSGEYVYFDSLPTTSSAGNVRSQAGTGRLYVNTSSRRFKKNIVNWSPDAERVLALQPRQWQHSDPKSDEIDERWHVGFVAEEVHDLGLKGLVDYVGDGKGGWIPQSLNYERFGAAHQVVLQKHEAEIKELREHIALLEAQIGTQ